MTNNTHRNGISDEIIMRIVFWVFVALGVVIFFLSIGDAPIPEPAAWVDPWTTWLATWMGIGVVVRGFWVVGDSAARYFDAKYHNLSNGN